MRVGRLVSGCIASAAAFLGAVLIAVIVITSETIMFDSRNVNTLIGVLAIPALVQMFFYLPWFIRESAGDQRNVDKLAKGSLLMFLLSAVIGNCFMFGLAIWWLLWEEGAWFLVTATLFYLLAGLFQYIGCRPY